MLQKSTRITFVTTPLPAADGEVGASRFDGRIQPSPTALPEPILDVDRSVGVAVQNEPARTGMHPHAEPLLDHGPTSAAFLTCSAWIHGHHFASGAFSLGPKDRRELCPPGIMYLLGQRHLREALDVEILDGDDVEPADQVERRLVVKIEPHATDSVVLLGELAHGLAPAVRATLAPRCHPLRFAERSLRSLVRSRVGDQLAVAECRERRDPHVHPDACAAGGQRLRLYTVAGKRHVPVTVARKRDRRLLDTSLDRPVQLELDVADARELDPLAAGRKAHAIVAGGVLEGESPVAVAAFEAGKSWSFPSLTSPKERAECSVESGDRVLQEMHVDRLVLRTNFSDTSDLSHLRVCRDRLARPSVRVDAMLESGVVQLTQEPKRPQHREALCPARLQTIAVDANHPDPTSLRL